MMTAVRAAWLVCDACDAPSTLNAGGEGETVTRAREVAAVEGWHTRPGGRDICGGCWNGGHR